MVTTLNSRQVEAVAAALRVFHPSGDTFCVQGLHFRDARARSFCTNDIEAAAKQAVLWDGDNPLGVYFCPNPIKPDFAGRHGSFPTEGDVSGRRWLLVDADPARPEAHAKDSATHQERLASWHLHCHCRGVLDGAGLTGALVADSGNGWHLCYPINMPNDQASKDLVKAVLKGLATRCEDQAHTATVGTECFDARRIWPAYGTWKRKGILTPERPHRLTRIIEGPTWSLEAAERNNGLLTRLLDMWHWIDETRARRPAGTVVDRARAYLAKMPAAVSGRPADPANGNQNHGHAQTFHVACVLVKDFGLSVEHALDAMQDWNQRCQPPWSEKELRHKLTDAAKRPGPTGTLLKTEGNDGFSISSPPFRGGTDTESEEPSKTENEKPVEGLQPIPSSKLTASDLATWIWQGYLARNSITLLSALWKAGKTTLLSHLLRSMNDGGVFCGRLLDPIKVLMVTEESEARWAERRDKVGLKDNIEFLVRPFKAKPKWDAWGAFLGEIGNLVQERKYDLLAFDTLANLWPVRDENDASQVQSALMPLHTIAEKAAVLLVHHNRKGDGAEATGSRGSGALTAFVDTIIELRRFNPEDKQCRKRLLTGYGRWDDTPPELVIELTEQGEYQALDISPDRKVQDLTEIVAKLLPGEPPGLVFDAIMEKWPEGKKVRRSLVFATLAEGADKGKWQRDGEGVRGNPHRYWRPAQ